MIAKIYTTILLLFGCGLLFGQTADLLISEYVEADGSGNCAIEIYNGTNAAIDLGNYTIEIYANGSSSSGNSIVLNSVMLAVGDVYVIADDGSVQAIIDLADQVFTGLFFNGDDAVALEKSGALIDLVGNIGCDPGNEWGTGDLSTRDNTIRRKFSACTAVTTDPSGDCPFPTLTSDWDGFPNNTIDGLGFHNTNCGPPAPELELVRVDGSMPLCGSSFDFGAIDTAAFVDDSIYIKNTGTLDLVVTAIELDPAGDAEYSILTAPAVPATIIPDDSVLVVVRYDPATIGTHTNTLTISSNDSNEGTCTIDYSGMGSNSVPIPDDGCFANNYAEKIIVFNDPAITSITEVNVGVKIDHPWRGDLDVRIISPMSTEVQLHDESFSTSDDINAIFKDIASDDMDNEPDHDYTLPYEADVFPETGSLSAFNGQNPNGTWTLRVCDGAIGLEGTLEDFELFINPPPAPEIRLFNDNNSEIECGADISFGTVDTSFEETDTLTIINQGNADLVLNNLTLTGDTEFSLVSPPTTPFTIPSLDTLRLIVQYDPVAVGTHMATLTIDNNDGDEGMCTINYAGQGATSIHIPNDSCQFDGGTVGKRTTFNDPAITMITDVNVGIKIDHTYRGDLDVRITSPAGTEVQLNDPAFGASNDDINSVFDDQATDDIDGLPNQDAFLPTYEADVFPELGSLSAFNGEDPNGEWTVTVCDDLAVDVGTFESFEIFINEPLMPVEFLYFTAKKEGEKAKLEWATAVEIDNDYFLVERSIDGIHFREIGRVQAAGNSQEIQIYNLLDVDMQAGFNYYRIRQVDFDGRHSFSEIKVLQNTDIRGTATAYSLRPTIADQALLLESSRLLTERTEVYVFDMLGNLSKRLSLAAGQTTFSIDVQALSSGQYILQIGEERLRFIKR